MVEQRIKQDLLDDIKQLLIDNDNEIDLTANDYGFKTAYINTDGEVKWDYTDPNELVFGMRNKMGEITELSALRDTIYDTLSEFDFLADWHQLNLFLYFPYIFVLGFKVIYLQCHLSAKIGDIFFLVSWWVWHTFCNIYQQRGNSATS